MVRGYRSLAPLEEAEADCLIDLIEVRLVMTPLIARHPKCPAKCVRHLSAMSGEPVTQPVHAGGRKFGNRVIGATWLGPNHSHRVTGSAAGRLLSLQHSD
jgi:Ser/Thr protein kinase RdoA (MazF antagonist)